MKKSSKFKNIFKVKLMFSIFINIYLNRSSV